MTFLIHHPTVDAALLLGVAGATLTTLALIWSRE
ncbi:hypothetical protein FHR34_001142 [Kitasatospora kifunensis]|uniref:Uncharacterized protein n=1 Tax=Kitasatospora kifunensis TaxID=58351 RepID=A0A7W7QYP6_KITKI|nr:hypothetical protein [Kitasatospora kifunensis]